MIINFCSQPLCVVTDSPLRDGWERDFLVRKLLAAGISHDQICWLSILKARPYGGIIYAAPSDVREAGRTQLLADLSAHRPNVVLACGDYSLTLLTGEEGIDKWHTSVLWSAEHQLKVIPCHSMDRVSKDLSLQVWLQLAANKCAKELWFPRRKELKYDFLINPPLEETLSYLRDRVRKADTISVDIETGRGQINTVGLAISTTEAIAINTLPERLGAIAFRQLWDVLREILESDQPKILQNFIYEHAYFSKYGIRLGGLIEDTMIRQKFLWPELEMGLDAVGRMYTEMPYWKDDGKSWNNIRDWEQHYLYNCKDTIGTFAGFLGQEVDLTQRGLLPLYRNYIQKLYPAIAEMCSWGIPLSEEALLRMRSEVETKYAAELASLKACAGAEQLNPRSPMQVKKFFVDKGYPIPKKYNSLLKKYQESTDEKSLKKLRMKFPEDPSISHLLVLSKLGKAQSSYLNFTYDSDRRMRYSLNAHGTETGRFAGHQDPWGHGVNPQTVPGGNKGINIKRIFKASEGMTFLQCDLRQAESRFVAYDSADLNLIQTLENPERDIHWEVALEILRTLNKEAPVKGCKDGKFWRQLGKKSGHGANYSMKEATFIDSCIAEMDVVLTRQEATGILEAYHKLFPGIRRWHQRLRTELCQQRMLSNPFGRQRHFYGYMNDDTFREAYAYRPQSTIPDITNHMILHLMKLRDAGLLSFRLLLQCHDSALMEVSPSDVPAVAEVCRDIDQWQSGIELSGGILKIPTEIEQGDVWGEMTKIE